MVKYLSRQQMLPIWLGEFYYNISFTVKRSYGSLLWPLLLSATSSGNLV